jgi:hypothetical protein
MQLLIRLSILASASALVLAGCGSSSRSTLLTTSMCGWAYTVRADGNGFPSGNCAGIVGVGIAHLTIKTGEKFSVEIAHEEDGRLDFPVPMPTSRAVELVGRRGAIAHYVGRTAGRSVLVARHSRYCSRTDPHFGTCPVIDVTVPG